MAVVVAWTATLLVSSLPNVILAEVIRGTNTPTTFLPAKLALLALLLMASLAWKRLRPLWPYFAILLVLYLAEWLFHERIGKSFLWQGMFGWEGAAFTRRMAGQQILRGAVALTVIAALWAVFRDRRRFFLARGNLDAPALPERILGLRRSESWRRLGPNLALFIGLGTLAFLALAGRPAPEALWQVVPMLPAVMLLAAANAWAEEVSYRASLLATLEGPIGRTHALWLTSAFFGIGHFYGVPYGIVGVLMAAFLGYVEGKCMVETRGLFWPWFIHFVQDVLIFSFMAAGAVAAGGR